MGDDDDSLLTKVPDKLDLKITKIIEMEMRLGRGKDLEAGRIRFGLYGNNCPKSVEQFVQFVSTNGLTTDAELVERSYFDVLSSPLSFAKSGTLHYIYPNEKLDFGILSQE